MRRILLILSFWLPSSAIAQEQPASQTVQTYQAVREYDPKRDAAKDIDAAIAEAGRTHKRILLEIGGGWCIWCRIMDNFFAANPALTALRDDNFVMVKINIGPGNYNEAVMSHYPKVTGYPYIFVLEENGELLKSQRTGEFESERTYNLKRWTSFLNQWATVRKCPKLKECTAT